MKCHASKVDNNYSVPPAPHSLDRDPFLALQDKWSSSQDYWLMQPQKTLAYARALQHWVEKAQPMTPGKPNQLAESMLELQCAMEPLTTFTMQSFWKTSCPPIGLRLHLLGWKSLPQGNAAVTGPIGLVLEDCFWQPMV